MYVSNWTVLTVHPDNPDKDGITKIEGESRGSKFSLPLDLGEEENHRSQYSYYTGPYIDQEPGRAIFAHTAALFQRMLTEVGLSGKSKIK